MIRKSIVSWLTTHRIRKHSGYLLKKTMVLKIQLLTPEYSKRIVCLKIGGYIYLLFSTLAEKLPQI